MPGFVPANHPAVSGIGGGTLTRDGATINVVVFPPNVYLKADAASWTKVAGTAAAGQLLAGKWLQTTTADEKFGSFAKLLDVAQLTNSIGSDGKATKGASATFHGKKALTLIGSHHGKLYVASAGKPYILGIVGTGSNAGNEIVFSEYNSATVPDEPTDAINIAQLQQTTPQAS
jgi:hypothetical protein